MIGTDGKRISYSIGANGKAVWSSNASASTKTYGNALLSNLVGKASLYRVISSDIKRNIVISSELNQETLNGKTTTTFGETIQGNDNAADNYGRAVNSDGTFGIKEATITIYEGSINNEVQSGSGSKLDSLSKSQGIGGIATHDNVHGSDKSEIDKNLKYEVKNPNSQGRPEGWKGPWAPKKN